MIPRHTTTSYWGGDGKRDILQGFHSNLVVSFAPSQSLPRFENSTLHLLAMAMYDQNNILTFPRSSMGFAVLLHQSPCP